MLTLDDNELEEMVSYRKNVTGVENTVFISPKGNAASNLPLIRLIASTLAAKRPRSALTASSLPEQSIRFCLTRHVALLIATGWC